MRLQIGMYIRTPFGIRKIENIKKDDGYGKPRVRVIELDRHLNTNFKSNYEFYTDEKVIKECKVSYNIIDLIEPGDYVNGYEVTSKDQFLGFGNHDWYILDNEIKSIVTKQQFSQMEYKVGE